MRLSVILCTLCSAAGTLLALQAADLSSDYNFKTITYPGATGADAFTSITAINDLGETVGFTGAAGSFPTSFVYKLKTSKFSSLSASDSYNGINDAKWLVGSYTINNGSTSQGFLQKPGSFETLLPSGEASSIASAVSNNGIVAGYATLKGAEGAEYFTWFDGKYTTVSLPALSTIGGVNTHGEIVGTYNPQLARQYGFLFKSGTLTQLNYPGSAQTTAGGINDLGDIVGSYVDTAGATHAYRLHKGVYSTLTVPSADPFQGASATGINNCGQIAGFYTNSDYTTFGFVATPRKPTHCQN